MLASLLLFTSVVAKETKDPEDLASDDDVLIVYELTPTPDQKALAAELKLPPTFFCYKNRPDYVSEDDDDGKSFVVLKLFCSSVLVLASMLYLFKACLSEVITDILSDRLPWLCIHMQSVGFMINVVFTHQL